MRKVTYRQHRNTDLWHKLPAHALPDLALDLSKLSKMAMKKIAAPKAIATAMKVKKEHTKEKAQAPPKSMKAPKSIPEEEPQETKPEKKTRRAKKR